MWFFDLFQKKPEGTRPVFSSIVANRQYMALHVDDAELRVWLPVACKRALDEIGRHYPGRKSALLREYFVAYLYGVHELLRMRASNVGLYYEPPISPTKGKGERTLDDLAIPERSTEVIPGLGKNIMAIKIFIPGEIKTALQCLADDVPLPLSTLVRRLLISYLLGHTILPEKLKPWSVEEERIGLGWEDGSVDAISVDVKGKGAELEFIKGNPVVVTLE
jgi:hypothetical protein